MKELTLFCVLSFIFTYSAAEMGLWEEVKKRAEVVHNYEYKALELSKKLRTAQKDNLALRSEIAKLKSEKEHMNMQLGGTAKSIKRSIASVSDKKNDLVNFELYKWGAEKLLGVGQQALHFKKYDKAAQFYNALMTNYPNHKVINDKVYFEAGIAAYESKKHYDWAAKNFRKVVKSYPKSKLYRGAKLWLALSHFHSGEKKKFIATVDEFRKKYRNTHEWKVLSRYYEDISYKYNR